MRHTACIALASLFAVILAGCGESGSERRTWQPGDHGQPPGADVDPSRLPAQAAQPSAELPEATVAGAASVLFRMMCASCHGLDGKGGGPQLPLGATPPDFTDAAWQSERTDAQIMDVVRQGRGMMPAFSEQIADDGLLALVGHLRRFGAPTAAAPAPAPTP